MPMIRPIMEGTIQPIPISKNGKVFLYTSIIALIVAVLFSPKGRAFNISPIAANKVKSVVTEYT